MIKTHRLMQSLEWGKHFRYLNRIIELFGLEDTLKLMKSNQ